VTAAQLGGILQEGLRPLRSSAEDMVPYYPSSGSCITTRHLVCYSHKIRSNIIWQALFQSLYIYIYYQSGRRWYWSIIGGALGHTDWELRDAPLGGQCGETIDIQGREPAINTR